MMIGINTFSEDENKRIEARKKELELQLKKAKKTVKKSGLLVRLYAVTGFYSGSLVYANCSKQAKRIFRKHYHEKIINIRLSRRPQKLTLEKN